MSHAQLSENTQSVTRRGPVADIPPPALLPVLPMNAQSVIVRSELGAYRPPPSAVVLPAVIVMPSITVPAAAFGQYMTRSRSWASMVTQSARPVWLRSTTPDFMVMLYS